jgi:zinc transport system substrate-binding protein
MRKKIYLIIGLSMIGIILLSACVPQKTSGAATKKIVIVSILPQQYFVERIAGDLFEIKVMVDPGQSAENYEPTPEKMKMVSNSLAYFTIGFPFEKNWMDKFTAGNPELKIYDTIAGFELLPMPQHHHEGEEVHEEEGDEVHEGELDPHVWLSPRAVKVQAQNIAAGLSELDPENAAIYQANLNSFLADIDQLDQEIQAELAPVQNRIFMIFHPAMGYFAHDYELEQISIEIEGTEPSAQEMAALIDEAQEEGIKVIFVQKEFSTRSAETIAKEIDGSVVPVDILSADWLNNMREMAKSLAETMQ